MFDKFKILFFKFNIFFCTLLLLHILYKSEIHWQGSQRDHYIFNFFLIILLVLISFIGLWNKKLNDYIFVTFLSFILSLYLFESYLSFVTSKSRININQGEGLQFYFKKKDIKNFEEIEFDTRTKMQVYKDLKRKNKNVAVAVTPREYSLNEEKIFALSGISNTDTIYCNENGYYSIYKSDRFGFNNPDKEWDADRLEFLLVGDSFIHGACVNRPNDITSVLRSSSKKSAINLGGGGNSALRSYASIREYLGNNVKNVLFFYYEGNDLFELTWSLKNKILLKYLSDKKFSQNLKSKQQLIDTAVKSIIQRKLNENRFLNFIKLYKTRAFLEGITNSSNIENINKITFDQYKKILFLTKQLVSNKKSNLYFVYLPDFYRYKYDDYNNDNYFKIREIVKSLDIPFIDIHEEVFKKSENSKKFYPFELYGHYNEEGYKVIGQYINQYIANK